MWGCHCNQPENVGFRLLEQACGKSEEEFEATTFQKNPRILYTELNGTF